MTTPTNTDAATAGSRTGTVPMRLEVTALPVADVDRAKAFYERMGWRLDIDFSPVKNTRGVQFTPPGSPSSIQFGKGPTTNTEPLQGLILVVDDIDIAREDLIVGVSRSAECGISTRTRARSQAGTRKTARTSAARPSPTRTAISGSCRRSLSGYPAACDHRGAPRWGAMKGAP